ncbi:MAG: glycerol-3-phosphate 1-O-acyltransferase PlsY [Clostridia bacterium]|nr:glycerol-3-phosphate 1-O-acyltransferase PlsY [Clostridia bacterium]
MDLLDFLAAKWLPLLVSAVAAYLLGSFNPAILVGRYFAKQDIRDMGSGNAGATNVLRTLGPLPAIITTVGDLAKSAIAVVLSRLFMGIGYQSEEVWIIGMYVAGLFCILGHLFPVYYHFRGGKGVMATLGMLLVVDWRVALIALAGFIVVVAITRYVSLGSMIAGVVMTVATFVITHLVDDRSLSMSLVCTLFPALITVIVVIKHRGNIRRLIDGTESKLSFGSKKEV